MTSYLFPECRFSLERLQRLSKVVGKDRLIIDIRFVFLFELCPKLVIALAVDEKRVNGILQ